MLQPIHAPLGNGDRISGIIAHLEDAIAPSLTLTTIAVRGIGGVRALVILHLTDGGREHLTSGQARALAASLATAAGPVGPLDAIASSLTEAADAADRQASAILLGMGAGGGVDRARDFGGR